MAKKILVRNLIISLIFIALVLIPNMVQAASISEIMTSADDFIINGQNQEEKIEQASLIETSNFIYNVCLAIGIVVAVIMAAFLGIQFMLASAGDKAEVKKAMMPFVVGCFVVFGAFGIWRIVLNLLNAI